MGRHNVEVVSYGEAPVQTPRKKIAGFVIAMVIILAALSIVVYFLFREEPPENAPAEELEAVIFVFGNKLIVYDHKSVCNLFR